MSDMVMGRPLHASGVVWIPVRVDGLRFAIGAVRPGDWTLCESAIGQSLRIAKALADTYERQHPEIVDLFAEAALFRAAKKP